MFAYLRGVLAEKNPTRVVVEAGGFGYEVSVPLSTFERLPGAGGQVFLHLHPCYREDSITLYGFASTREKQLFNLLLGVSGVGPKLALTILSGTSPGALAGAIATGDEKALGALSGVGRKLSQRLVTELREPIAALGGTAGEAGPAVPGEREAVAALVTLGYTRLRAVPAVRRAAREHRDGAPTVEELVKTALQKI